jgi:hypothetical protein
MSVTFAGSLACSQFVVLRWPPLLLISQLLTLHFGVRNKTKLLPPAAYVGTHVKKTLTFGRSNTASSTITIQPFEAKIVVFCVKVKYDYKTCYA